MKIALFCAVATGAVADDAKSPPNTVSAFVAEQLANGKKPNRLIHEKSPYLLQHAFNPVDWYPWGTEAFNKARKEDKPIFVSIGYSTCHWCHVMAAESFENPAIAAILNRYFVNVKVDREERPDLDRVYMAATQAMTGKGGWPMSVFLTHDLKPFFTGTYYPPQSRYGLPGFSDLLTGIHKAWATDKAKLMASADKIIDHLKKQSRIQPGAANMTEEILNEGYEQIAASYDEAYGGFGDAPKFPQPAIFNFLLRYYHRTGNKKVLEMTLISLRKMAQGGIQDHLGGGFHRYAVDGQWRVPHFEKMLYDQAQLALAYLEAYQISAEPFYARTAQAICDYVLRDMTSPEGAFYSAEDADSPLPDNPEKHGEGAFYVWSQKEIDEVLGEETGRIFNKHYGIEKKGNVLSDPQQEFAGLNILYVANGLEKTILNLGKSADRIEATLTKARQKLFNARARRPRPHLDDKVITSWNGLMIAALARGYQVLGTPSYLEAAERAARFVVERVYDSRSKTLWHRYRDGAAGLPASLKDYVFFVAGLLDLYEASLDIRWLTYAIDLTDKQVGLFWDDPVGGFFETSGRDETVLLQMKEYHDGAEPAGNSLAALNLLRLSQITHNAAWRRKAVQTLSVFAQRLKQYPAAMPQLLAAIDFQLSEPKQIIIAGSPLAADTQTLLREVYRHFLPNKVLLLADGGEGQKQLSQHLPIIAGMKALEGRATAYVCENYVCRLPAKNAAALAGLLESTR